jgi:hypothetical protein
MRLIRGLTLTAGLLLGLATTTVYAATAPGLTRMLIETPGTGATVAPGFLVAGYAFDPEAVSGSGVDGVVVYAFHDFGSGEPAILLGLATYGITREDVGRAFGSGFTGSGFQLATAGLGDGNYRIFAFAHNVATGMYSAYVFVDVTVTGVRALVIEAPAASASVMSSFEIDGWAIDSGAASGTGVDAIHLYLSPIGRAEPPIFLGAATYGLPRADIASAYGSRFTNSGFRLTAGGVRPGSYLLSAFAYSTATGSFSITSTRWFTVDATMAMSIDVPSAGAAIDAPAFGVMGWAIDRAAANDSGVDTLHVYGFHNPGSGEPPIFLGVARTGVDRGDVAAIYGAQFGKSGYELIVDRSAAGLAPGEYDIVVWAHSSVCNAFEAVKVVRVTLR